MMVGRIRFFLAVIMLFLANSTYAVVPNGWTTVRENASYSISYQRVRCDDRSNGVAFDFFAIRLENKSGQKLNLQWFNSPEGEDASDEKYVSLILAPGEVMQGNCDSYANNNLMVLVRANAAQPRFADLKFYLL